MRFLTIFWLKIFDLGPIRTENFFVFAKIFDRKVRKSGVPPEFSLDTAVFKLSNYCYWMCLHTNNFFLPNYSFKICEKSSKLSKSFRVVIYLSALSMTSPTPCPRSRRLQGIMAPELGLYGRYEGRYSI